MRFATPRVGDLQRARPGDRVAVGVHRLPPGADEPQGQVLRAGGEIILRSNYEVRGSCASKEGEKLARTEAGGRAGG